MELDLVLDFEFVAASRIKRIIHFSFVGSFLERMCVILGEEWKPICTMTIA